MSDTVEQKAKRQYLSKFFGGNRTDRQILIRLLREYIAPSKYLLMLGVFFAAISGFSQGAMPYALQLALDRVFNAKDASYIYIVPAIVLISAAIRGLCMYLSNIIQLRCNIRVNREIRLRIYGHIINSDIQYINSSHSGHYINIINLMQNVGNGLVNIIITNAESVMRSMILIGTMYYLDPFLTTLFIIFGPLAIFAMQKIRKKSLQKMALAAKYEGDIVSHYAETFSAIKLVKAYNQEQHEVDRLRDRLWSLNRVIFAGNRLRYIIAPIVEVLISIGVSLAILYASLRGISGEMTVGQFTAFMTSALLLYIPFKAILTIPTYISDVLVAGVGYYNIVDAKTNHKLTSLDHKLVVSEAKIEFKDVTFSYDGIADALSNLSFQVKGGSKVALIGLSGSGKSTIFNLLLDFFPIYQGEILVDDQSLALCDSQSIRSSISLLMQDPVLFNDSIYNNIAYGSENVTLEKVRAAAEAAAAHDFIEALPEGYDTQLSERGSNLSGGQKQRIAIARAFLQERPILLLDEPTSSLDSETEQRIQAALERLFVNKTVIVIAHRLSTIKNCDQIVVLSKGQAVETGSHEELIAKKGNYFTLYNIQYS